jgi:hypothetical protein
MLLSDLLVELREAGITIVLAWQRNSKKGVTLADPLKFYPHLKCPQYPIDTTDADDPDLSDEQVKSIRRRFGIAET